MTEITRNIHVIDKTRGSYSYLILGQEPVLVDTGMKGRGTAILDALHELGLKPTDIAHIVLTHQDGDHIGNAKFLKHQTGATLWAPSEEVPYIHGERNGQGIRRILGSLMHVDRPQVDQVFGAGAKVGALEVIPAPGHTPGHVCLFVDNVLLAGDLVVSRKGRLKPSPGFLTWNKAVLKQSIQSVGRLAFEWVCPAHGDPVQRGSLWEAMTGETR